jgi:hypothetical protein
VSSRPEPKVVLCLPLSDEALLAPFVEDCLADSVSLIAVHGEGCEQIEDQIDWLIVGEGADESRYITTSSHPGETLEEVLEFAADWRVNADGPTRAVRL